MGQPNQPAPQPAPQPTPQQPPAPQPAPQPTPQPPAPQPAPAPQQQPPAATFPVPGPPPGHVPAGGPPQPPHLSTPYPAPTPPATGNDLGFPEGVHPDQMPLDQQVAYWRHHSRRWEGRSRQNHEELQQLKPKAEQYDQIVSATQTEQQRAIAEAAARGRQDAIVEGGERLVEGWLRAAAAGRLDEERVNAVLSGLNRRAFVNASTGEVDTARVYEYVNSIAPPLPAWQQVPAVPVYPVAPVPAPQPATGQAGYATPPSGQPLYPGPSVYQPVAGPPMQPAAQYPGPQGQPGYPPQPGYPTAYAVGGYVQPAGTYPPGHTPDFGQGRPTATGPTGLAAGRAAALARFGDKARSAATGGAGAGSPAQQ